MAQDPPPSTRRHLHPVALVLGTAAVALGSLLGAWYLPFVAGVGAGYVRGQAGRAGRLRASIDLVVLGPVAWWLALVILAFHGARIAATGSTVAALVGLPARAEITLAVTAFVALLEIAVGAWLGRTSASCFAGVAERGQRTPASPASSRVR